jgi:hypothetical protein
MLKTKAQQALEFVRREAKLVDSAIDLHNLFFGNGGQCGKLFPTRAEREAFFLTPEFEEIDRIQEELENRPSSASANR